MNAILRYLQEKQTATVDALAKKLFISATTVRRDLSKLEKQGVVKRLHGGAMLLAGADHELPLFMRSQQNVEAKKRIAERAAQYLQDGQVIFLDASSTAMFLAPHFERFKSLTIITNGVQTAEKLSTLPHCVYCTGGRMLHNSAAYVGDYAIRFIRQFNADIFFFSSRGISESGQITDASSEETQVRRAMLEQSRKQIFLYDHHKRGQVYCYNLCSSEGLTVTICDEAEDAQRP